MGCFDSTGKVKAILLGTNCTFAQALVPYANKQHSMQIMTFFLPLPD